MGGSDQGLHVRNRHAVIFTVPVVLGDGKKLFADGSAPHSFKLTRSRVSPNGLMIGHYEREN